MDLLDSILSDFEPAKSPASTSSDPLLDSIVGDFETPAATPTETPQDPLIAEGERGGTRRGGGRNVGRGTKGGTTLQQFFEERNIDNTTGIDLSIRAAASLANTPEQARAYLARALEEKHKDTPGYKPQFGRAVFDGEEYLVYLNPDTNKWTTVDPDSGKFLSPSDLPGDTADILGDAIPVVTGAVGSVKGALAGPAGAIAGAGAGAAAGQALKQELASAFDVVGFGGDEGDIPRLSSGYITPIALEGALGAGGEVLGRVATPVARNLGVSLSNLITRLGPNSIRTSARVPNVTPEIFDEAIAKAGGIEEVKRKGLTTAQVLMGYGGKEGGAAGLELVNGLRQLGTEDPRILELLDRQVSTFEDSVSNVFADRTAPDAVKSETAGQLVRNVVDDEIQGIRSQAATELGNIAPTGIATPEAAGAQLRTVTRDEGGAIIDAAKSNYDITQDNVDNLGIRVMPDDTRGQVAAVKEQLQNPLNPALSARNMRPIKMIDDLLTRIGEGNDVSFRDWEKTIGDVRTQLDVQGVSADLKRGLNQILDAMNNDLKWAFDESLPTRTADDAAFVEQTKRDYLQLAGTYRDAMNLFRREAAAEILKPTKFMGKTEGLSEFAKPDSEVFKLLQDPNSVQQVQQILRSTPSGQATQQMIQEGLRKSFYDSAVINGELNERAALKWLKDYSSALPVFFDDPSILSRTPFEIKARFDAQMEEFSRATANLSDGFKARVATTADVSKLIGNIWNSKFPDDITRLRALSNNNPLVEAELQNTVLNDLYSAISSGRTGGQTGGVVSARLGARTDANDLDKWLTKNGDKARIVFGDEWVQMVSELRDLGVALSTQRLGQGREAPVDGLNRLGKILGRMYFGVFTPEGRIITGAALANQRIANENLIQMMLNPQKVQNTLALMRTFRAFAENKPANALLAQTTAGAGANSGGVNNDLRGDPYPEGVYVYEIPDPEERALLESLQLQVKRLFEEAPDVL